MQIKVNNLKTDLEKLNNLINTYYDDTLNMYNELSYSSNYWEDNKAIKYYDNIKKEKIANFQFIEELEDLKQVYQIMIERYEKIGNNIKCNLKNRYNVLNYFDKYLNKISKIVRLYRSISDRSLVENHIVTLQNNYSKILSTRKKIAQKFNEIENIEKEIKRLIDKVDVTYLKESEIREYL